MIAPAVHRMQMLLLAGGLLAGGVLHASAQSITTAAIRGTVRTADGSSGDGARVSARNLATGFVAEAEVKNGRFLLLGLEPGGPWSITARRIGMRPERREGIMLSLGEPFPLGFVLEPAPQTLESIVVAAPERFPHSNAHGGTATTFTDSLIHRLPTLNRDGYDFVRLVPQMSTRIGQGFTGMSAGGVGFRLNNFLTNGVPERSLAGGQPPEFAGGKSLPFEAVGEYQVLLAPFDVRYGDFAGAAVNTITRSGTNAFRGSVFVQSRSDDLARGDADSLLPYERWMYGASLGGPIRRDQAHFLVAVEFQRLTSPMQGPFVGQPADQSPAVKVRDADVIRLASIMQGYGLMAGSGGVVPNRNPLRNIFLRFDATLGRSRAVLWANEAETENLSFVRGARDTTFALSSTASTTEARIRTAAAQLHTVLSRAGGGHNELFLSYRTTRFGAVPVVRQPIVTVTVPSASGAGFVTLVTGTPAQAQAGLTRSPTVNLRDNLSLPLGGHHLLSLGAEAEWFRLDQGGLGNGYGTWSFLSLDSLEAGRAERLEIGRDLGSAATPLRGAQYALYAGDRWQAAERLHLTLGLRGDLLTFRDRPPANPQVEAVFGRSTDRWPGASVHLSPRFGFTWDPSSSGRDQVRGGAGLFTGRPPLAWYHTPLRNYGTGIGILRCGAGPASAGPVPGFEPDEGDAPTACDNGAGATPPGDVELIDPGLRMARTLRAVLAWDRRLPGGMLATLEALFTRQLSDFMFENLNLVGPQSTDATGRVLYGTVNSAGRATPALRASDLPAVIDLVNISANHAMQLSARLDRRFAGGTALTASYTWSRVRDVQTPLRVNNRGVVNWSSRALSGRHDDRRAGISGNDIPHRVVLAGTWRAPWIRWGTELSFLYVGESGSPFTYRSFGLRGLGDLNADGSNANDPVYIPNDATDAGEILFTGISSDPAGDNSATAQAARVLAQQTGFEKFIAGSECLRRERGRILTRNRCREPWAHTTALSVRQEIPVAGRGLEAQLDLFNVLNLLDGSWGQRRVASPALLEHVGQNAGRPVFRYEPAVSPWTIVPAESAFQLQFGVRYRF